MLVLFVNFSCQKDESNDLVISLEKYSSPSIEAAQSHFNQKRNTPSTSFLRTESTGTGADWESSLTKEYKKTSEIEVDILYTPVYLNTQFNAKAFIASTEYEGVVDSRKIYVMYKANNTSNGLSAYIVVYNIDGVFDKAYNYEDGVSIAFPTSSQSSATRTTDCSEEGVDEMTDGEFEDFLANCYGTLDEVDLGTIISSSSSTENDGGGGAPPNPIDTNDAWVDIDGLWDPIDTQTGGTGTGTNPEVFAPNIVSATAQSIATALEIGFFSIESNWLQEQENQNNLELLNAIAEFLNAHKERPIDPAFENTADNQLPVINEEAINNIIDYINHLIDNPLLGADCASFEYAQPPGALQKGCAVKNFNHRFYAFGFNSDGSSYAGYVESNIDLIYFTMPTWMTNGHAANLTAIAVTDAIIATDLYFFLNPYDSEFEVGDFFKDVLTSQLSLIGGSMSTSIEPFPIPSPAPYLTSFFGASTNCD